VDPTPVRPASSVVNVSTALPYPGVFIDEEMNMLQARNGCLICVLLRYLKSFTKLLGLTPFLHDRTASLLASHCNISKFSFTWSLD
jgi:hypothetical protein